MNGNNFGYLPELHENVRDIFRDLCQDVAWLHSKWELYLDLFSTKEAVDVLGALVAGTAKIVEEALRDDIIMSISRLSDPARNNLVIETLVEHFDQIDGFADRVTRFQDECEPIRKFRNKQVAHNDEL